VRVALADFRWPLDPALAAGRDETTLARALYATPLRIDPATGAVRPGLCRGWSASADFRVWTFTCRSAPAIAAALRRVGRLREAPLHWLFADAEMSAPAQSKLVVRLPFAWRRFPYVLTAAATAPRFVAGPFRLVSGSRTRVVLRRDDLKLVFRRLSARAGVREFRRGSIDESPVPLGDIAASKADHALARAVRVRTLLGLDIVFLRRPAADVRRAYWETANRADYEELVPEVDGSSAYGLLGGEKARPARFRRALKAIKSLPRLQVRIGVPPDPALRYAARLLYADWRDVGLGPRLVGDPARSLDGSFRRVLAAFPQQEAIPVELALRYGVPARSRVLRALAATQQDVELRHLDEELRATAFVVPIAWVVDARLVSPRLEGWREDVLGNVDYAEVRSRASSRRP
jgi:hypothetical protein